MVSFILPTVNRCLITKCKNGTRVCQSHSSSGTSLYTGSTFCHAKFFFHQTCFRLLTKHSPTGELVKYSHVNTSTKWQCTAGDNFVWLFSSQQNGKWEWIGKMRKVSSDNLSPGVFPDGEKNLFWVFISGREVRKIKGSCGQLRVEDTSQRMDCNAI